MDALFTAYIWLAYGATRLVCRIRGHNWVGAPATDYRSYCTRCNEVR